MAMEEKERVLSNLDQPFVILPDSQFRSTWDIMSLCLLLYVGILCVPCPRIACFASSAAHATALPCLPLPPPHCSDPDHTRSTPFQIAFLADKQDIEAPEEWPFFFAIDRIIDLVFLADIVINFRSAWYTDEGIIVFLPKDGARRYVERALLLLLLPLLLLLLPLLPRLTNSPRPLPGTSAGGSHLTWSRCCRGT